ncbi:hypothetical protein F4808DRAFT_462803 [Astrocystis sublimbata]|nr:hypothetical protein F4808DRAFT_462967 [Astrocystis sublimbata]KAI0198332.1 hypothetical protein F4808DRAFT_462803 [Astrocystis sublimbata]
MGVTIEGVKVAVTGLISTPLAILALGLRLWSRRIQKNPLAFNDYMAIIALILAAAIVSLCLADAFIGAVGAHAAVLEASHPEILTLYSLFFVPGEVLWAAANTSVKLSTLSLYTILFPSKKFSRICYGMMGISAAYFLSVFLETFFLCKPIQYNWDKSIPDGQCSNQNLAYLLAGVTNLVIDAIIVALPMPKLYGLQIPLARRLAIGAMFALGAVICVLSLLRILSILSWNLEDPTYTGTGISVYSILEPTLGVVNACLPTIRPALRKLFRHDIFSRKKSSNSSDNVHKHHVYPHQFEQLTDDGSLSHIVVAPSADQQAQCNGNKIAIMREWKVSLTTKEHIPVALEQPAA